MTYFKAAYLFLSTPSLSTAASRESSRPTRMMTMTFTCQKGSGIGLRGTLRRWSRVMPCHVVHLALPRRAEKYRHDCLNLQS